MRWPDGELHDSKDSEVSRVLTYRNNPAAIGALVADDRVHRDVYIDPEMFELEMEHLWRNTWIYVGHDSQVPRAGDFYATKLGAPARADAARRGWRGRVLFNRCAHKGTKVVNAVSGNVGPVMRCPYHGWTYRLDGSLRTVPLKSGYEGTRLRECSASQGLARGPCACANYRGFVFARLAQHGPDFDEYFGEIAHFHRQHGRSLSAGRLEVAGGVLRYMHDCNWKMFVENLNDAMHPMVAHESSAGTAKALWAQQPADAPKPMVIEQFAPFVNGYDFFERMGVKVYENGHSYTGVNFSIHSKYSSGAGVRAGDVARYGEERAQRDSAERRATTRSTTRASRSKAPFRRFAWRDRSRTTRR